MISFLFVNEMVKKKDWIESLKQTEQWETTTLGQNQDEKDRQRKRRGCVGGRHRVLENDSKM